MAEVTPIRVSELPELTNLQWDEWLYAISGGLSYKTRIPHIPNLITAGVTAARAAQEQRQAIFHGDHYNIVGGVGIDETSNIQAALEDCGTNGGGTVVIRAQNPLDPIYIDGSIQINYSNVTLRYESPLLYGPLAMQRINGGLAEMLRTHLGQIEKVKLRADATTDVDGRMVLPLRVGDGQYLQVGDRITLRGENDAFGKAMYKQVTAVLSINVDDVTCTDEPEYDFKAVYPESAWPSDWTTGTTVAISVATEFTVDAVANSQTLQCVDPSAFAVGDLVYISDTRTEADVMAPVVTTLKSAAVMEIARVAAIDGLVVTLDRALKRTHLMAFRASMVKMDPVTNSHIKTREISWAAPQPNRRNAALAINYGDRCTIQCDRMDGRMGRVGIGIRIAYSYQSHALYSNVADAYSFASAEGYGIALYYSTFCSAYKCEAAGGRHNYLLQTATCCDINDCGSLNDWISGIDLHGAGSVGCRVFDCRVSRSTFHSPGVTNGGGIRNGNTSHTIGDHDTEIRNNLIEGYVGAGSSAIDISPSSNGVQVLNNRIIDCQIGVRHYNVGSAITPAQHTDKVVIDSNWFIRCIQPTYIRNWDNSIWDALVFSNNRSIDNTVHFKIEDIAVVEAYRNEVINPTPSAGAYAFDFDNIAYLRVFANIAGRANRGVRVANCTDAKIIRNWLSDVTEAGYSINSVNNTSLIEAGNDDTGGGGGGTPVEFQTSATHVQWRNVGDVTWNDLVSIETLSGTDGTNGTNGREVEMQATATHIQWRYMGDATWTNLVALDDIVDAPKTYPNRHFLVPIGDSRSAQNWSYSNTTPALLARGPIFQTEQQSRRVRAISKYRQGVSGNEVEDIWARIQANTPNDAGVGPNDVPAGVTWFFLAGTNNITGATDKAYIDGVLAVHQQIVDWAIARGDWIIISTEWPRNSTTGTTPLTTNEIKLFMYYVQQLRTMYKGRERVAVTDIWSQAVNPASVTADPIQYLLNPDGLHNSIGVAYLQGKANTQCLIAWNYPIIYHPTSSNADVYDAALNPNGNIIPNPMFQGSAGTVSTGATGVAPDSWTMDATNGLSVVGSRETIEVDGVARDAFKMVISGTTSATGAYARLRRSSLLSSIAINEVVEGGLEVIVADGFENFCSVGIVIDPGVSTDQVHGGVNLGGTNGDLRYPPALVEQQRVFPRSPQYVVPGTLPASLAFDLRVRFAEASVASSATVYVLSGSFRKAALDG